MALVKLKPTSPGRRHAVKVVTPGLHKGKPFAALLEKKKQLCWKRRIAVPAATTTVTLRAVTRVVAPSVTIALSTSCVTRTAFPPALNASNTIRTVPLTSRSCCMPTANVATSSARRA